MFIEITVKQTFKKFYFSKIKKKKKKHFLKSLIYLPTIFVYSHQLVSFIPITPHPSNTASDFLEY